MMLEVAQAALPDSVAVWAEKSDGRYVIYSSELIQESWSKPVVVIQSDNKIINVAIGSKSAMTQNESLPKTQLQESIAVWTEVTNTQWKLKYSTADNGIWSPAQALTSLNGENLAATIVHDRQGWPWVFWSSNALGDDDIYVSRRINGQWSDAEMVNDDNQFPDILPKARIAENGDLVVEWDTLDTTANVYINNSKIYPSKTQPKLLIKAGEETSLLNTPEHARTNGRINLHYPKNKSLQSVFVQSGMDY